MNEPTEQEINRGIAEWMGYSIHIDKRGIAWLVRPDGSIKVGNANDTEAPWEYAPRYTTSHNECHQALERMTDPQFCEWHEVLLDLVGVKDESDEDQSVLLVRRVMAATAHQKAIAIYRVVKGEGR